MIITTANLSLPNSANNGLRTLASNSTVSFSVIWSEALVLAFARQRAVRLDCLLVRAEMKHFSPCSWVSDAGSSLALAALSV